MFDALFDDEDRQSDVASVHSDGAAAPPHDCAAAPARIHHREDADLNAEARHRIRVAQVRQAARRWKSKAVTLAENATQAFSRHVASVCFNRGAAKDRKLISIGHGETLDTRLQHRGRDSHDAKVCSDFGSCSAVLKQAEGISNFLRSIPSSRPLSVVAVNTMDDCSMWVKDPATRQERGAGLRNEGMRINNRLWRRGKTSSCKCAI